MNPEATQYYIELTHEQYKEKCGKRLGDSILGIFTDEPHRGTLMDSFGTGGDLARIPWSACIPEEFKKRFGYDLIPHLAEIYYKPEGPFRSPGQAALCRTVRATVPGEFSWSRSTNGAMKTI